MVDPRKAPRTPDTSGASEARELLVLGRLTSVSLTRGQAVGGALGLTVVAAVGDFVTTADTAFTLFYLAPIGLAGWHVGPRFGLVIAALCTVGSLVTVVFANPRPVEPVFVAWNTAIEVGIFVVILGLVLALRSRFDEVAQLRGEHRGADPGGLRGDAPGST